MVQPARPAREPAMIAVPMQAPTLVAGAVMCAVSLVASARPMQLKMPDLPKMPNMPNMPSLPKLPSFPSLPGLPGQGKTEEQAKKQVAKAPAARAGTPGRVVPKVRAGGVKIPIGSEGAPTLADVTGGPGSSAKALADGAGWKRFPGRRTAGASLDIFREIAREIGPQS
jgi:hypothetical protein